MLRHYSKTTPPSSSLSPQNANLTVSVGSTAHLDCPVKLQSGDQRAIAYPRVRPRLLLTPPILHRLDFQTSLICYSTNFGNCLPGLLDAKKRLAHSNGRQEHLHYRRQVQGAAQGGDTGLAAGD